MISEKYIGLDVHQATISVAVMNSQGEVVMESIQETKASTIPEFFAGLRAVRDLRRRYLGRLTLRTPTFEGILSYEVFRLTEP